LIELGESAKEAHRKIGEKIAEVCDLAIITTKDYFKDVASADSKKIILIENPKDVINKIKEIAEQGDAVLLEGRLPKELIKLLSK
ncbi:MAG: hypothetical protein Q7T34_02110, partial [Candidatus Parcubacteria bacterium]|nr:hypothetical protein [Candidatus Parcubacteria bacterium]